MRNNFDNIQTQNSLGINKRIILLLIVAMQLFAVSINDFINTNQCDHIIDKQVYKICYDYRVKGALFVAYTLDGTKVNSGNIKKRPSFYTEKNLKKQYRSHTRDYTHSGYDRGHLANDASFDYDKKILSKTFSMANIIPQAFYDKPIYTNYIILFYIRT